jgi:hypothetical protein
VLDKTNQQIQCLLFPAPPGALGVDVQDIHGIQVSWFSIN